MLLQVQFPVNDKPVGKVENNRKYQLQQGGQQHDQREYRAVAACQGGEEAYAGGSHLEYHIQTKIYQNRGKDLVGRKRLPRLIQK